MNALAGCRVLDLGIITAGAATAVSSQTLACRIAVSNWAA